MEWKFGICVLIKYRGEMDILLSKIEDGLRSSISYSGGLDLSSIRNMRWGIRRGGVRQ